MKRKQSLLLWPSVLNSGILSVIIHAMHTHTNYQSSEVVSMPVYSVGPDPADVLQIEGDNQDRRI